MSRNPRQQHSATLESYLIKPIQRILKYPLLLQQMKVLTEGGSDEHRHLGGKYHHVYFHLNPFFHGSIMWYH